jgi:hypothetical protein
MGLRLRRQGAAGCCGGVCALLLAALVVSALVMLGGGGMCQSAVFFFLWEVLGSPWCPTVCQSALLVCVLPVDFTMKLMVRISPALKAKHCFSLWFLEFDGGSMLEGVSDFACVSQTLM